MKWAGGWSWMRWAWAAVALWTHLPRALAIEDAYASTDASFVDTMLGVNAWLPMSPGIAYVLWAFSCLAALAVGHGRFMKPALLVWLPSTWILLCAEALNMKAYDRLLTWLALALLVSPAPARRLKTLFTEGWARLALVLVYVALYTSTGWLKLLEEPSWTGGGEVLALHLVHSEFGTPTGALVSGTSLVGWLALFTVVAECSFVLLVWFRRTNPISLAMLACLHVGIALTMDVGPFSWVALAGFPVLLHPSVALRLYSRWRFSRRARTTSA